MFYILLYGCSNSPKTSSIKNIIWKEYLFKVQNVNVRYMWFSNIINDNKVMKVSMFVQECKVVLTLANPSAYNCSISFLQPDPKEDNFSNAKVR